MRSRSASVVQTAPQRVLWAFRLGLLSLAVLGTALRQAPTAAAYFATALLAAAIVATAYGAGTARGRLIRTGEVLLTCLAIVATGLQTSPFLGYLSVPVLAAGLVSGVADVLLLASASAGGLLAVSWLSGQRTVGATASICQYVVLAALVGLLAAWAPRSTALPAATPQPLVETAYRLLTELRTIARQLPGTLDPITVATELLEGLDGLAPAEFAAVYRRVGDGRLIAVAGNAEEAVHWDVDVRDESVFAAAWQVQHRQLVQLGRSWLLVVPLVVGRRSIGLAAMEGNDPPPVTVVLDEMDSRCAHAALRIETAVVFDDIRDIATTEERSRLAREIHDGIAQELVTVGYSIDSVLADMPTQRDEARVNLTQVRGDVTRIISDLRLSLFDLRSHVDPHGGLGTALASYLRATGSRSGLRVHLTLDEAGQRLPTAVETELFRIVQEAVTNVRKHAYARNLWVSVEVQPPLATLVVEDDGIGVSGQPRSDSHGHSIMRERAVRAGAELAIGPRPEGGTKVSVTLRDSTQRRKLVSIRPSRGDSHANLSADR